MAPLNFFFIDKILVRLPNIIYLRFGYPYLISNEMETERFGIEK